MTLDSFTPFMAYQEAKLNIKLLLLLEYFDRTK